MATQYEQDLAMVQEDGWALQFVKEQTEAICLAAVQENGWALSFVEKQTTDICLSAVKQDGDALIHVKDLHAIADEIDESIITEGLKSDNQEIVLAYQKLVKIREANAIAKRINNGLEVAQSNRSKVKL